MTHPISKRILIPSLVFIFIIIGSGIYYLQLPSTLTLKFNLKNDGNHFQLNTSTFSNPGGEGTITVRDFQFFISNIVLTHDKYSYIEPDSYHLARFDQGTGKYEIVLSQLPQQEFNQIEFGIGVDKKANSSIQSVGDLNPNSRMAWNWEVGYKFLLLEGTVMHDGQSKALVYHVGFDENYRRLSFPYKNNLFQKNKIIMFDVDPMTIFSGAPPVDMMSLSSVKFDKEDAARLSSQFPNLIEIRP